MQDMDILAYIVLGHPLGSSAQQASLLTMAASALLTSRQSEDLLGQIKNRLGVSTLEISSGTATSNGRMGYKPIKVAPVGTQAANSAESVSQTMLVVGKYLTPNLYVSYGRSIFTGGNLFFLRYNLSKNWQVESQTGQESGVDIYYKIEFN
jgi:translocation and assembly module TamB